MKEEQKIRIAQVIKNAKQNGLNWLDYQAGNMTKDVFRRLYIDNFNDEWVDSFMMIEWLEEEAFNNPLPNGSSGSTFTALTELDNLYYEMFEEGGDHEADEAMLFAQMLYEKEIQPLVTEIRRRN
jgi:hypothetical protein